MGVIVNLETTVDAKMVRQLNPDTMVLATGSTPCEPEIPGVDKAHVVTALDVLLERVDASESAIVVGGGSAGCEAAMLLAERGCRTQCLELLVLLDAPQGWPK